MNRYFALTHHRMETCRNAQSTHICHTDRREGSCIFSHMNTRFLGFASK
jgi:hypothetical protein